METASTAHRAAIAGQPPGQRGIVDQQLFLDRGEPSLVVGVQHRDLPVGIIRRVRSHADAEEVTSRSRRWTPPVRGERRTAGWQAVRLTAPPDSRHEPVHDGSRGDSRVVGRVRGIDPPSNPGPTNRGQHHADRDAERCVDQQESYGVDGQPDQEVRRRHAEARSPPASRPRDARCQPCGRLHQPARRQHHPRQLRGTISLCAPGGRCNRREAAEALGDACGGAGCTTAARRAANRHPLINFHDGGAVLLRRSPRWPVRVMPPFTGRIGPSSGPWSADGGGGDRARMSWRGAGYSRRGGAGSGPFVAGPRLGSPGRAARAGPSDAI